ncbi:MAG: hypothetical protein CFE21_07840 [Bacteroidetes bacterium B1(2017)]|nr:MAG: hypothetical protein CFE21_07840 [Bacteroidetes bacterium B1(2017)]
MQTKFIWPILQEIDALWLSIAFISVFFFFFIIKVKFQKQASLKSYGVLFYSFVFYTISAFSFLVLNALDTFFRLQSDVYSSFIWFFPFALISAITGALVGLLIYWAGTKTANNYVLKLMNLSLLVIAPYLTYALLIQPFKQTLNLVLESVPDVPAQKKELNAQFFTVLLQKPQAVWEPAMPSQVFDSLSISISQGNKVVVTKISNGFSYSHLWSISDINQVYVSKIIPYKQLAILCLSPAIQGQSALGVIDSLGNLIYLKTLPDYVNRMSVSKQGQYILLEKSDVNDSANFVTCIQLKP